MGACLDSFLVFVRKQKKQCWQKTVRKCREETRLALLSVPPEKIPDCFQTVRQSYLISLYRMRACDIAFGKCGACDIAFVACAECDKCDKCDIAFVASIFIIFLDKPFYPSLLETHPINQPAIITLNILLLHWFWGRALSLPSFRWSVHLLTVIGRFCSGNTTISITASPSPHPLLHEGEFTRNVRNYGRAGPAGRLAAWKFNSYVSLVEWARGISLGKSLRIPP